MPVIEHAATERDCIHLQKTGLLDRPFRADGNLLHQQRSPQRGFTVVTEELHHFIDDLAFVFFARSRISGPQLLQHFFTRFLTHFGVHRSVTPLLSQRMTSSSHYAPPSVTIFLSQIELIN